MKGGYQIIDMEGQSFPPADVEAFAEKISRSNKKPVLIVNSVESGAIRWPFYVTVNYEPPIVDDAPGQYTIHYIGSDGELHSFTFAD